MDSTRPPQPATTPQESSESAIRVRIGRAIRRARLALLWEAAWPRLIPPFLVAAVFLTISWFGLWIGMPEWIRVGLLVLFGLGGLASLVPLARIRMPDNAAALARVERATGAPHRPATGVLDKLGAQLDDPATQAIWAAHRARLLAGFGRLKAGIPSPGVPRRDPYALRFLVVLLALVGLIAAGAGFGDRLADAFRGETGTTALAIAARIDAWAAPPEYTGRPPIFLTGPSVRIADAVISVPDGTELIVRISGETGGIDVLRGELGGAFQAVAAAAAEGVGPLEFDLSLTAPTVVAVRQGGAEIYRWTFAVIPDEPPTIAFLTEPVPTEAGALRLAYTLADDYGVVAAAGDMTLVMPTDPDARPLFGQPEMALTLPARSAREGEAVSLRDMLAHPWAGLDVQLALVAEDARGQQGRSAGETLVLPERRFTNPIALALIDERRILALDANKAARVASALDLLTLRPEAFMREAGVYLPIRSAYYRLLDARDDDALRGVVDYLWEIAVGIEDDQVADAAAEAQAAAEALREALDNNAPPEEIAQLTEELRQAMQDYLQALAEAEPLPPGADEPAPEVLNNDQLDQMLDALREMAEAGNRDGARQLLDQLQQMLQNMQVGNIEDIQQPPIDPPAGPQALEQIGDIIQQQQQLRDETFALQQQQNQPMPTPRTDEEARQLLEELRGRRADQQAQAGELQRRQQQLEETLQGVINELEALGMEEENNLANALEHMNRATEELGQTDAGTAMIEQGAALDALRGGAQAMIERLLERRSLTVQRTQAGTGGQDPLGRPLPTEGPDFGNDVEVPDEIDRQRARQILEIIRDRLEDADRPIIERDYLERLINAL